MKYKVGDKVKIVDEINTSIETMFGTITIDSNSYSWIKKWLGKVVTIDTVNNGYYTTLEIKGYYLNDEMIEGIVLNGEEFLLKLAGIELPSGSTTIWECPDGYIFKDENGNVINATKIVLEKKKNEYPKTYEDCCEVMNTTPQERCQFDFEPYGGELYNLHRLLICRDAYWKIAGEEMGLGKPWKPDWNDLNPKFVIAVSGNEIKRIWEQSYQRTFAFPTEEMRDAFYDNFKELINECKELL